MSSSVGQPLTNYDEFPAPALYRLASCVLGGDVVFFVGSGFSIDSEGNTAVRLMQRLLIRLCAIAGTLGESAETVRTDLANTFAVLGKEDGPFPCSDAEVRRLSDRYYETNPKLACDPSSGPASVA
jgi:hypothetical protein